MMAPKLRFLRGLKAKAPGAVTACVPAATPLVDLFAGHRYLLNTKSNDGEGEDFFLLLRVFQVFDCYFTNSLTEHSRFEVLLTADSQLFTLDDARTLVPTIPRQRRAFVVSLNIEVFLHSCEQRGHFFFSPGAPVAIFLSQPISTVIPVALTFNKTKRAVSSIAVVTKAIKCTDNDNHQAGVGFQN